MSLKTIKSSALCAFLCAGLVLVAGCSRNKKTAVEPQPAPADLVEILLNGGVVASAGVADTHTASLPPSTRAVVNQEHGALQVSFARLDQQSGGSYPAYATLSSALSATLAANTGNASSPAVITFAAAKQYYQSRATDNNTKLVGWYPQAALAGGIVSLQIDGENDIMLTQELEGNKEASSRFGTSGKVFSFKHLLTQVKVKAYAADAAAVAAWGQIAAGGILVKNQLLTCVITLPANVAFSGTAADLALPAKKASDDSAVSFPLTLPVGSTAAVDCGYAMIKPVAAGDSFKLKIVTQTGGTYDDVAVVLPSGGFEAGKAYTVLLKFTATEIQPTATISAWEDASDKVEVVL